MKRITPWVIIGSGLDLLPEDQQVILRLNCRIVLAGNFYYLRQKFPQVGGLQPTFAQFQPQKQEMVQALNPGANNWVALPNIGCSPGSVHWLNSLHGSPSLSQERIVADLVQATVNTIETQTMNVQKQLEGSVCGLFALAFITAILKNQDPTPTLHCFQQKMRGHPIKCLEKKTPLPFPITKHQNRKQDILHTMVVPITSVCRLLDDAVQYNCLKWYHVK